jgi:hypothetical protein
MLYLTQKGPQTAKEALSLAISFQAARSFNDMVKKLQSQSQVLMCIVEKIELLKIEK